MGFLKLSVLSSLLLSLFGGCAKFDYLYEQSVGQISLQSSARDNQEMLKNVRIPAEQKDKIRKIQTLKKYFYSYWGKKETAIYSQTTMLQNKAVTYLVVASPFQEIKAEETCFPLMGCFPYLGFFNLSSAKDFAKKKEAEDFVTWVRPVYAYSTLGYFTDTILSSFFHYNDYELAELIFHELFHTIFFINNQVELNENLANYFAKEMLEEYFTKTNQLDYLRIQQKEELEDKTLRKMVVNLTTELQEHYQALLPKTKEESQVILDEFLEKKFRPSILKKCQEINIPPKNCFPIERQWNNASFAAFLTYEKKSDDLEGLQKKLGLDLRGYYSFISKKYNDFKDQSEVTEFSKYLFQ
ncbi:MAG: aminopeptidase [Bacteriovorax sp.]|nr:aminopeptidase [Bacteriovorax sp.]